MICLKPLTITDALLTSSNVPEPSYVQLPEWDVSVEYAPYTSVLYGGSRYYRLDPGWILSYWVSGTTYAAGDVVNSPLNDQHYVRLVAGAGTVDPSLDATNWVTWINGPPNINWTMWALGAAPAAWVQGTTYSEGVSVTYQFFEYMRVEFFGLPMWSVSTIYSVNDYAVDPVSYVAYLRKSSGSGGSRPGLNATDWLPALGAPPPINPNWWQRFATRSEWVSGATYAVGDVVSVPSVFKFYTRTTAGAGTVSPESDSVNWLDAGPYERTWISGATYAYWDQVILPSTHRKYRRSAEAGISTIAPNVDTASWVDDGPTNKWACFDTLRNTKTVAGSPLVIVITPQVRVKALYLMGLKATSFSVAVSVDGIIMTAPVDYNLIDRSTASWSAYFFGSFKTIPGYGVALPPYSAATITITITHTGGEVELGAVCLGTPVYVGAAQYNAVSSALNFSTISRDVFGGATLVPRRSVPKTDQITVIDKALADSLYDLRIDINAIPCIWSTLDDLSEDGWFKSFLILGVYREFSINAKYPTQAEVTLQIEEV